MKLLAFNWDIDLGFIVAAIGLVIGVISFIKARRLEKQQYKLNEYALEDKKREREEAKHARIRIEPYKSNGRCYMMVRMKNEGKCDAKQIKVAILNDIAKCNEDAMKFDHEPSDMLEAGRYEEIGFFSYCSDFYAEYQVSWVDDAGEQSYQGRFKIICNHD